MHGSYRNQEAFLFGIVMHTFFLIFFYSSLFDA